MYKCCIHILGCLLIWAIASSAQAASQQIHIDDPRFIKNPPAHILEKFTLDEDGYIIDGPRQADGEPIDYTSLITNDEILESFSRLAFGSSIQTPSTIQLSKWKHPEIYYEFVSLDNNKDIIENFYSSMIDTYAMLKLKLIEGQKTSHTSLKVFFGGRDELESLALSLELPEHSKKRILSFLSNEDFQKKYIQQFGEHPSFCFPISSLINYKAIDFVTIFVSSDNIRPCTYRMLLVTLGFLFDANAFSSTAVMLDKYNALTDIDIILLRILYDTRLQADMIKNEAMPIAKQILTELRPEAFYNND